MLARGIATTGGVNSCGIERPIVRDALRFGHCREQVFRGFPHMPGTDFVTRFAKQGDPANSGGKLS